MKFLKTKAFIGVVCFVLGVTSMFGVQRFFLKPKDTLQAPLASGRSMDSFFDQFYDDDFFKRSPDPFEEMKRMRDRMMRQFGDMEGGSGGTFDSWYKKRFGGGDASEIERREDDKYVYYDIKVQGVDQKKLSVKVGDGQVQISGEIEKKAEGGDASNYYKSSFHRSFPVPPDVDANKVQMTQEKDKLVIKFPKVSS